MFIRKLFCKFNCLINRNRFRDFFESKILYLCKSNHKDNQVNRRKCSNLKFWRKKCHNSNQCSFMSYNEFLHGYEIVFIERYLLILFKKAPKKYPYQMNCLYLHEHKEAGGGIRVFFDGISWI